MFNEPLATTLFCSYTGMWYPHYCSHRHFVQMALQRARAICRTCRALRQKSPDVEFVHVETAEYYYGLDRLSAGWVRFANARRFLLTDLILGRISARHELYSYLLEHGATRRDLDWFRQNLGELDVFRA